ncbi:MAG: hypothetical protein U9P38_08820 [Campylobacterota bacterium]|nr:hypothetical protein [Campylobacterota bacterium]
MKTIQLQIDDNNYDSFMIILNNLKQGFVKNLKVNSSADIEFVSDEEQQDYENILNTLTTDDKIISSKESIQI